MKEARHLNAPVHTLAPPPDKALVLCADDYAVHAAASQAIVALAQQHRLSATSAMVLSPRWSTDAAALRELRGQLDVGLHLDWTSDFARSAGHGLPLGAAMRQALRGGFDPAAARVVIERQLDAFESCWQAPPDHVDGHQHIHQFRGIREALVEALVRRYPQAPPWLRIARAPVRQRSIKSWVIAQLGAQTLAQMAQAAGLGAAPWLSGIYNFQGGIDGYARHMERWLSQSPAGTVIMCHPAAQQVAGDAIGAARAWEYAFLTGDAMARLLAQSGVRLARGRQTLMPPLHSTPHE